MPQDCKKRDKTLFFYTLRNFLFLFCCHSDTVLLEKGEKAWQPLCFCCYTRDGNRKWRLKKFSNIFSWKRTIEKHENQYLWKVWLHTVFFKSSFVPGPLANTTGALFFSIGSLSHSECSSPSLITPPQSPLNLETSSFASSQSQNSLSTLPRISVSPVSIGQRRKDK